MASLEDMKKRWREKPLYGKHPLTQSWGWTPQLTPKKN